VPGRGDLAAPEVPELEDEPVDVDRLGNDEADVQGACSQRLRKKVRLASVRRFIRTPCICDADSVEG